MTRILVNGRRGTNRVIAICRKHGAPPPTFEERQGFLIVIFKVQMVPTTGRTEEGATQPESQLESRPERIGNDHKKVAECVVGTSIVLEADHVAHKLPHKSSHKSPDKWRSRSEK